MSGTLYLLPSPIGAADPGLPVDVQQIAHRLDYFLVEDAKSARAFLKRIGHPRPMRELRLVEIGHTPDAAAIPGWLAPLRDGSDGAVVAEAGCPAIADPGSGLVAAAHAMGLVVRPLVGPCSIILALMASGLNGQQFRFLGYLPIPARERATAILALEQQSRQGETQIFIETPYRGAALFDALLSTCAATTRLSVAIALGADDEFTASHRIGEWRKAPRPDFERRPAVFCLLA